MTDFLNSALTELDKLGAFAHVTGVLSITLVLMLCVYVVSVMMNRHYSEHWVGTLILSLKPYILSGLCVFALFDIASLLTEPFPKLFPSEWLYKIRNIVFILFAVLSILKFKKLFLESLNGKVKSKTGYDSTLIFAMDKVLSIGICLLAGLIALDHIGVPIATLLAFGGIGGFAVSWAAKDVIANLFGGLMIFLNRPFMNGDWISSSNKHFEGVVEEIGWYRTQIRSFDRRPTYIPNSLMTDAIVQNPGRMYNRRIKEIIGLRYEDMDVLEKIIDDIRKHLKENPHIDQELVCMVHFVSYGDYSLNIQIYCFTKATQFVDFSDVLQDILFAIAKIVKKHNADFAFPTQTIHTPDLNRDLEKSHV